MTVRKTPDVAAVCAAMHNVCMRMDDEAPEEMEDDENEGPCNQDYDQEHVIRD